MNIPQTILVSMLVASVSTTAQASTPSQNKISIENATPQKKKHKKAVKTPPKTETPPKIVPPPKTDQPERPIGYCPPCGRG
ncbi:MAG: hypothetical protein U0264_08950 [Candidatus Kapaibacterium sp.]